MISGIPTFSHSSVESSNAPSSPSFFNTLSSKITTVCHSIFTPDAAPTWNQAALKVGLGLAGLYTFENYCYPNLEQLNSYRHMVTEGLCTGVSTGILVTGIREMCSLTYNKLTYKAAPPTERSRKRFKTSKASENNVHLSRSIKIVKLIGLTAIALNCLYNYELLGTTNLAHNLHFAKDFLSATSLPHITNIPLQMAQIGVCSLAALANLQELKEYKKEDFLSSRPISEILNAFVIATFFSQINVFSPQALDWYRCLLPNIQKCYKTKNIECQLNLKKCQYLLPRGSEGVRLAKHYMDTLQSYWLTQAYTLEKASGNYAYSFYEKMKQGHLQLSYLQDYSKNYALTIQCKNTLSLIKNNIQNYWNLPPLEEKAQDEKTLSQDVKDSSPKRVKKKRPHTTTPALSSQASEPESQDFERFETREKPSSLPAPHIKKKTRGIPNKNSSVKPKGFTQKSSSQTQEVIETVDPEKEYAKKALEDLKILEEKNEPIPTEIINKWLSDASKFMNGGVIGKGGSKWNFQWFLQGDKRTLPFETPHKKDSNNYVDWKRKRILQLLETIYLSIFSPEEALRLVEKYNFNKLRKFKGFIHYVLLNKTTT